MGLLNSATPPPLFSQFQVQITKVVSSAVTGKTLTWPM
jgi:hypothetical protein